MNTQKETMLHALTAVLLAPPFALKVMDESRVTALQSVINNVLPANVISDNTIAAFASELATKYILLDTQNPTLCHIPDSQLYAGKKTERELVAKHDFTVNLVTDTEYRLATYILQLYSKQTNEGTNKELHFPAYALEALQLINGLTSVIDLKGEKQVTNKSDSFDYEALGLNPAWFHSGIGAVMTLQNQGGTRHIVKPEHIADVMPLVFTRLDIFSMKTESSTVEKYAGVNVITKWTK